MVSSFHIDPARPLIICDADEVLLQFMAGLEGFLHTHGYFHDFFSFRIHGNVRDLVTKEPITSERMTELLGQFFATQTQHLQPVPGAAAALAKLSRHAQILVLSNLPETSRDARIENLTRHGMPYPVIAGKGPKGVVVKDLIANVRQPVVFIDDLPPHITSVATETPQVHRLHFVADPRLAKLLPPCPDAHRRIDDWPTAEEWITSIVRPA